MKALYFDGIPPDVEAIKDQDLGKFTVLGATVYISQVFQALLRHSSYDAILLPASPRMPRGDLRDTELFTCNAGRLRLIPEYQLAELSSFEHLVFASPVPSFLNLIRIRRLSGHSGAPATGVIHSLNGAAYLQSMLTLFLSPLRRFDAMICSSTAGRDAVMNFAKLIREGLAQAGLGYFQPSVQMPVIPLGVDVEKFDRCDDEGLRRELSIQEGPVLLYFGRFSAASKGDLVPLLIAFSEISRRHPEAWLVLAGDDTRHRLASDLNSVAAELGCQSRVRIVANPTTAQKFALYGLADVFVSPSDSLQETFGIAIVEAMAAGLPVVASDWDGYKDLVVHGKTGYLVPTLLPQYPRGFDDLRGSGSMNDTDLLAATTIVDMNALVHSIDHLLGNPHCRRAMGEAGRRRALSLYAWPVVIKSYEELWDQLVADAANAPAQRETGFDLTEYAYHDVFGHYPTSSLSVEASVRLSCFGKTCLETPTLIDRLARSTPWFQLSEFSDILRLLASTNSASVHDVVGDTTTRSQEAEIRRLGHLCRLMKCGLVELTN